MEKESNNYGQYVLNACYLWSFGHFKF